ncbi:hypothetical protein D3C80_1980110 [compost metagenome]
MCTHRVRSEDWEFLHDEADIRIVLEDGFHVWERTLAVATIVIEELINGYIAIRITEDRIVRRIK